MSRWLVIKDELGVLPHPFIDGEVTAVGAINHALPVHMIGIAKRVRAWENPDFMLQKVVKRAGESLVAGPVCGYKYHHPTITKL